MMIKLKNLTMCSHLQGLLSWYLSLVTLLATAYIITVIIEKLFLKTEVNNITGKK